jgi:hypothetical protein
MSWNYRVLELDDIDEGKYFEIKEVYYNRDGTLMGYCDATVSGGSLTEIMQVLESMRADAHRAVLRPEDFKGGQDGSAE